MPYNVSLKAAKCCSIEIQLQLTEWCQYSRVVAEFATLVQHKSSASVRVDSRYNHNLCGEGSCNFCSP